MDDNIKLIESDLNKGIISRETIDIFNNLVISQKAFNRSKDIDNKRKKEYNYRVLVLKKELVNYYNKLAYELNNRLTNIKKKVDKLEYDKYKIEPLKLYDDFINNAQDSIKIDFNLFLEVKNIIRDIENNLGIIKEDNSANDLEYFDNYQIPKIVKVIDRYKNGDKTINKQAILIDINILRDNLKEIEKKYKDDNLCLSRMDYLDNLSKQIMSDKNSDYYDIKNDINFFIDKLNKYKENIDYDRLYIDLLAFTDEYNELMGIVQYKYRHGDKQLFDNLINSLQIAKLLIGQINDKGINEYKKVYQVTDIVDSKEFYQKYDKEVLLSTAISSMALNDMRIGQLIIPTLIFANNKYIDKYEIVAKVNEILLKAIKANKNDDGTYMKSNGIIISDNDSINCLLKALAISKYQDKKVIDKLIDRVNKLAIKVKMKERLKNKHYTQTKKDKYKDLKDEFIKIFDYVKDKESISHVK